MKFELFTNPFKSKSSDADNDMPFQRSNTTRLFRDIKNCKNDKEYRRLFDPERAAYDHSTNIDWKVEYTNKLKGRIQISDSKLASACMVNVKTGNKWKNDAPGKREHYVAIACLFGLGVDACSRIMNRFGGYDALDENNPNDIVYIRLLQISERPFEEFDDERMFTFRDLSGVYSNIKWELDSGSEKNRTLAFNELNNLNDIKFIELYNKANSYSETSVGKLHEQIVESLEKMGYPSKDVFFRKKDLHSMYPKALSNMSRQKNKIIPKRNLLISLFLHMALPLDKINEFLGTVNMEPLCSKNPYESALIHVLSMLYREHPEFEDEEVMLSTKNDATQKLLKEGSLYMFVYSRLLTFSDKFEEDEIDLNECMCRNLTSKKEESR